MFYNDAKKQNILNLDKKWNPSYLNTKNSFRKFISMKPIALEK